MAQAASVEELVSQTKSKYALVVAAARRGRAIMDGYQPLVQVNATKPVTIALEEIQRGLVSVEVPPSGIK
ncbi:DNA-directed RNA polymerase subunit omega [Sulfobacillus harzensis]|uniref:DNA-directed RNA polymerase subunit omega n=1 Tax=Sulfobacillus harzensis TaxID=2729629 RepID=A0A7Y0Q2J2_9FIRM|nr:DNA-directed RNA polymerase subunit omega [Sulfobacillus harzensis]